MTWHVTTHDSEVEVLVQAIIQYLQSYPNAADTVDGVTNWWLAGVGIHFHRSKIIQALALLERHGMLKTQVLPSGGLIYSRGAGVKSDF